MRIRFLILGAVAALLIADPAMGFPGKHGGGRGRGRGGQGWKHGPPAWAPAWGYRTQQQPETNWNPPRTDDDDDYDQPDESRGLFDPRTHDWSRHRYDAYHPQPYGPWHRWQWQFPQTSTPTPSYAPQRYPGWGPGPAYPGYYGGTWNY